MNDTPPQGKLQTRPRRSCPWGARS
jgi:hypothetical protein